MLGIAVGIALGIAAPAIADPVKPYPDLSAYTKLDWMGFQAEDNPGVWFSTPTGLNCGIWTDGSYGCNGALPGGGNQVAWFPGDDAVHVDATDQPAFVAGVAHKLLPPKSYVVYRGVKCGVTQGNDLYCSSSSVHDFMVTPTKIFIEGQQRG